MTGGCCECCCRAIRPRYKRLVCNIYPENIQEGLVKDNMQKLTFYALSSPEKLDRIGEYMAIKLHRDLHRHRIGYVFIALEAMDQLLMACHSQTINMFVESFLKILQKLLECQETDLQCAATASFVKFSNIEEDTPSYHRGYDFFVSKFSSMCHSALDSEKDRRRVRTSGIRGIQGIIRKTISDDLQVNIWDPVHMDKIVPSLLFNMHDPLFLTASSTSDVAKDEEHPCYVSENVFRDVVNRASYGNIKPVIRPILVHLDNHRLWTPNDFSMKVFKIIMYSVQAQHGYLIIQCLMSHLDARVKSEPNVKAGIVDVLYETVLIAAGGSIGPSVLEVFNTLLRHLRVSVDASVPDVDNPNQDRMASEKRFQYTVINTIGEFANNLPDYQKIEIMMFVMSKLPQSVSNDTIGQQVDIELQSMLLKTMLKVATKYQTVLMTHAFPDELLNPLLKISLSGDHGLRILVQEIFHTLLDRHGNSSKLQVVTTTKDLTELDLTTEKCPRQDINFMKRTGVQFYSHIYENMLMTSNITENYKTLYITLILITIEIGVDEMLPDILRLVLQLQKDTIESSLNATKKCSIHGLLAAFMNLVCQLTSTPGLYEHTREVLDKRYSEAKFLLPEYSFSKKVSNKVTPLDNYKDEWIFSQSTISSLLTSADHDISLLTTPFTNKNIFYLADTKSKLSVSFEEMIEEGFGETLESEQPSDSINVMENNTDNTVSTCDVNSVQLDVDSADGSPLANRKHPVEEITFESLKRILTCPDIERKEKENKKRMEIIDMFRTAPFEEIVAKVESKSQNFPARLNEILDFATKPSSSPTHCSMEAVPITQIKYPDHFLYQTNYLPQRSTKV